MYFCTVKLSDGVIGNTSDSGSEESRFETWSDNIKIECNKLHSICFMRDLYHLSPALIFDK